MDAVAAKPRRRRRWPYLVLILLLGFAAYTAFVLTWSYSEGERVGVIQKLSRKGYVCKTSEGELALYLVAGMAPQIWTFTIRDAQVKRQLDSMLGERVRLHYTEHKGIPSSCFGDTPYFVDSAVQVDTPRPASGATMPSAPMTPSPVPNSPSPTTPTTPNGAAPR